MAAASYEMNGAATGVDLGEAKRRNVSGQTNGSYIPKEVEQKLDEKTKKKVGCSLFTVLGSVTGDSTN